MKPIVGQRLFHQPTRVVVEVLEVQAEAVRVRPLGSQASLRWNPGLMENDARLVAPDGFRVIEYTDPDRTRLLLSDSRIDLLRLIARDEQARGEDGLKKSVVRTYLKDNLDGTTLERVMTTLSDILDTSPAFERKGEGKELRYTLRGDDAPLDECIARRIDAMDLRYSIPTRERLVEVVGNLLDSWPRERTQPEAVARLGRIASGARDLLPAELFDRVIATLLPTDDGTWSTFRLANAFAQVAVVERHHDKRDFLRIAVWHPSLHREARVAALERLVVERENANGLARVVLPGSLSVGEQAAAIDEAVGCSPDSWRSQIGRLAFVRLCRLKGIAGKAFPALAALCSTAPMGVLVEWIAAALAARARPERAFGLAESLGQRLGMPSDWMQPILKSLQLGAFLTAASDSFAGPFGGVATENPTVLDSWMDAGHRRIHGILEEDPEPARLAALALSPDANAEARGQAVEVYLECAVRGRRWAHIGQTFKDLAALAAQMKTERDEALRLASDLGHAKLVVTRQKAAEAEEIAVSAEAEAHRMVANQLDEYERRAASTLSEALTALQTVAGNLPRDEPVRNQVLAIEKRLLALARRWSWEPIGRAWEPVSIEPALHDVSGDPEGLPVIASVGIRSTSQYDGKIILRARVVRRRVESKEESL